MLLNSCAEFSNLETKLALVVKDHNSQRDEYEFTFGYSGKDCGEYFFLKMTLNV